MDSIAMNKSLFNSIKKICNALLKQAGYCKVINGYIKEYDRGKGAYKITYDHSYIYAYFNPPFDADGEKVMLNNGSQVFVLLSNGTTGGDNFIIGVKSMDAYNRKDME